MALHHFPTLGPDELLYSAIARYAQTDGCASSRVTTRAVLGAANRTVTWDLPIHLEEIGAAIHRTPVDLVEHHTLWPYYACCLPRSRALALRRAMLDGRDVHAAIGITASSVAATRRLRYCVACADADQAMWGAMYWHRTHQCPGVACCPIHAQPLVESSVEVAARSNRHHAVALASVFKRDALSRALVSSRDEMLVAQRTHAMLNGPAPGLTERMQAYRDACARAGWMTVAGRVRWRVAIGSLLPCVPIALWTQLGVRVDLAHPSHWLIALLRSPRRAAHPLLHVLAELLLSTAASPTVQSVPSSGSTHSSRVQPAKVPRARRAADRSSWCRLASTLHGPKEMRRAAPALYARLYRHSRTWLVAWNARHAASRTSVCARKDWAARDAQLAHRVTTAAMALQSGPSALNRRISKAVLLRSAGSAGLHAVQLAKMPTLSKVLATWVEDRDRYVTRRLRMTIAALTTDPCARAASWRVLRAANIRGPWTALQHALVDRTPSPHARH